jgi:hypothetical protein
MLGIIMLCIHLDCTDTGMKYFFYCLQNMDKTIIIVESKQCITLFTINDEPQSLFTAFIFCSYSNVSLSKLS